MLLLQSGASTSGYGASTSSNGIVLSNDSATLAAYGAQDDMTLLVRRHRPPSARSLHDGSHCTQVSSSAPGPTAEFSDLSQVDKVVMSDAEYAKRNGAWRTCVQLSMVALAKTGALERIDTVLAYKQRNKLGRFDESKSIDGSSASSSQQVPPELQAGARCEVSLGGEHKRRGTVRHVGPTQFGAQDGSVWVGVEFDEPVGKGDGRCVVANPHTHKVPTDADTGA